MYNDLPVKVKEILALKDCYWLNGWDADEFMAKLCAWQGIGLGIPNPAEWVKGMEAMLPAEARKLLEQNVGDAAGPDTQGVVSATPVATIPTAESPEWLTEAKQAATERRPQDVVAILEKARPESERNLVALDLWARSLFLSNEKDAALAIANQAVQTFPNDAQAYQLLGYVSWTVRQYEQAVAAYKKALSLDPDAKIHFELGIVLKNLNRLDDAVANFTIALDGATTPEERATCQSWLGSTLNDLGKHAEAISNFERAASVRPSPWWELFFWGQSLKALGQTKEAEAKLADAEEARKAFESQKASG